MSGAGSVEPSRTRLPWAPTALPRLRSDRESPLLGRNQCSVSVMAPEDGDAERRGQIGLHEPAIGIPTNPIEKLLYARTRETLVRTEQLEYVAAVARLGSFRRAAEELHISAGAVGNRSQPRARTRSRHLRPRSLGRDSERQRTRAPGACVGRDRCGRRTAPRGRREKRLKLDGAGGDGQRGHRPGAHAGNQAVPRGESGAPKSRSSARRSRRFIRGLRAGSFDLGLVTTLVGDESPTGVRQPSAARRAPGRVPSSRRSSGASRLPSQSTIYWARR